MSDRGREVRVINQGKCSEGSKVSDRGREDDVDRHCQVHFLNILSQIGIKLNATHNTKQVHPYAHEQCT